MKIDQPKIANRNAFATYSFRCGAIGLILIVLAFAIPILWNFLWYDGSKASTKLLGAFVLIYGSLAVFGGFVLGLLALILGQIGLRKYKADRTIKGLRLAFAGSLFGGISILMSLLGLLLLSFFINAR